MPVTGLSALGILLTATIQISGKVFELRAVGTQAKAVVETVKQVSERLEHAKTLLREKATLFTALEKQGFDDSFRHTERAVHQIAALAEEVRADMEVSGGHVRMNTRMLFVLRDSSQIQTSYLQLIVANQDLNAVYTTLCSRDGRLASFSGQTTSRALPLESKSPPTYEESEYFSDTRRRNLRRRASALPASRPPPSPPAHCVGVVEPSDSIPELSVDGYESDFTEKSISYISLDKADENIPSELSSLAPSDSASVQTGLVGRGRDRSRRWFEARYQLA